MVYFEIEIFITRCRILHCIANLKYLVDIIINTIFWTLLRVKLIHINFSVLLLLCVYLLLFDCVCVCFLFLQVSLSFSWYHNCGKHLNSPIKFIYVFCKFWNYLILFIVIIIIWPQNCNKLYYCDPFIIIFTLLLSIITSITWTRYIA